MASVTAAGADIVCYNAFSRYMIISLAFEAANRFFLVLCDGDLFVADYQTIKDGIVGSIGAVEGDVQVSYLLVRRASMGGFRPAGLDNSVTSDVVYLCHFRFVVFVVGVEGEGYEESHHVEGPRFGSSLES